MKKVLSFIVLLSIGFLFITGCDKVDPEENNNEPAENKSEINITADENIEVKTYFDYENYSMIVYMTNNNDYNIGYFETKAVYYDKDGNKIDEDYELSFSFKSGSDYALALYLPHDAEYNSYIPDRIDLTVDVDEEYQQIIENEILYNDKIATDYKVNGNNIDVTVTNNSDKELAFVDVAVLFIKDDKPIAFDYVSESFEAGQTITESVEVPIDWEKSIDDDVYIEYDSIKLIVNEASID